MADYVRRMPEAVALLARPGNGGGSAAAYPVARTVIDAWMDKEAG